jgi:hypothetical protein
VSRADDGDDPATVSVISGHPTPDELAVLVAVCLARARRAGPAGPGGPHSGRPAARWGHPGPNPAFLPAHSWRSAGPPLSPAAGPPR